MPNQFNDLPPNIMNFRPRILGMRPEVSILMISGLLIGLLVSRYSIVSGFFIVILSFMLTVPRIRGLSLIETLYSFAADAHSIGEVRVDVPLAIESIDRFTKLTLNNRSYFISELRGYPVLFRRPEDQASAFEGIAKILDQADFPIYFAACKEPAERSIITGEIQDYTELLSTVSESNRVFRTFLYTSAVGNESGRITGFGHLIEDLSKLGFKASSVSMADALWLLKSV